MWPISILAMAGNVLNIKKRSECFVVWCFTNAAWCVYDYKIGAYSQSVVFAVYFIFAVWGLCKWKREEKKG
jgi:nicotinamide riboside transporter PnuC